LGFQKCQTSENKNIPEIKKIFKRRNITKKNVLQFKNKKQIFSNLPLRNLNLSAHSKNSVEKKISPKKIPSKINESFWDDERKYDSNFTKKKNQSNIDDNANSMQDLDKLKIKKDSNEQSDEKSQTSNDFFNNLSKKFENFDFFDEKTAKKDVEDCNQSKIEKTSKKIFSFDDENSKTSNDINDLNQSLGFFFFSYYI